MEHNRKKFRVMNMCDYCVNEITTCNANSLSSDMIRADLDNLDSSRAVVACDKYENPVASVLYH